MWQCISSTCRKYAGRFGFDPKTTDDEQQLIMFRAYVKDRYGTPEAALAFWRANGYY